MVHTANVNGLSVFSKRAVSNIVILILLVLVQGVGCGDASRSYVTGTISIDGKPLPLGTISFVAKHQGATGYGTIQEDGSYKIKTGSQEGCAPGEYLVTIVATEMKVTDPSDLYAMKQPGDELVPQKYGSKATTDLSATVVSGNNQIDFPLKSNESAP